MGLAVAVLLWLLAGLLAVLIVIVIVPIHLNVTAQSGGTPAMRLQLRLLSAGLPPLFTLTPGGRSDRKEPAARPAKVLSKRKKRTRGWFSARLRQSLPRLLTNVPGLIADTLSGIHLDLLHAKGRFGFSDPAETGRVFGQLCPVIYALPTERIDLTCTPDFNRRCLEGEIELAVHFQIIRLASPTLGLLWRAVIWPK